MKISEVTYQIDNINCNDCSDKIKNLEDSEGILNADFNQINDTVHIKYNNDKTVKSDIKQKIEYLGYNVKNDKKHKYIRNTIWTTRYAKSVFLGSIFLLFGLILKFFINIDIIFSGFKLYEILLISSTIISGYKVGIEGVRSLKDVDLNISFLVTVAMVGSLSIGYYIEASSLAVLFGIAEILEDYAMDNAKSSLNELIKLSPDMAKVKSEDDNIINKNVEDIEIGDIIVVNPGEKIPVDGKIINGTSSVDESPITGESVPKEKDIDDSVYAGSINKQGYLEICTKSKSSDSVLSNIIELINNADMETKRERFVDEFASYYTPIIVIVALFVIIVPPIFYSQNWNTWIIRGLTLLVVACPCAFVISTPVAVVSAVTNATKNGVIIKSGKYLELISETDVIAVDKTGTITEGNLKVSEVIGENKTEDEITKIAYSLESKSEHPLAKSIVEYSSTYDKYDVTKFENLVGMGIKGKVNGKEIYVGKPSLFNDTISKNIRDIQDNGDTLVVIGEKDNIFGYIVLSDKIRESSKEFITNMVNNNIKPIMITGDNNKTASKIAKDVGIDEYYANMKPNDKIEKIKELKSEDNTVAMVGDGINDSPALKEADIGISMGSEGSDTAIEAGDISLLDDNLSKVSYLINLSKKSIKIIKQNVFSSILAKVFIALLVPFGYISVALAVLIGDMGMTLVVIINSMRISN